MGIQGNILGQSGSSSSSGLNVYAQLAEPSKKDGIWIKTEGKVLDELKYSKLADIPNNLSGIHAVVIETNVYLFSRSTSL